MLAALAGIALAFHTGSLGMLSSQRLVRAPEMLFTRREAFAAAACSSVLLPTAVHAARLTAEMEAAAKAKVKPLSIDELTRKARSLRSFTITASKTGTPMEARHDRLVRKKEQVLMPLLAAITAVAPTLGLPEEKQKRAELLPMLMKGHFLELDEAIERNAFEAYESKSQGKTYAGGKVERELEEVIETAEEFLELMAAAGK